MEKRRSERKQVHIRVKLNVGDNSYDAFINNVSYEGIGLNIILAPDEKVDGILPNTILGLGFQTGPSTEVTLQCDIKWVNISSDKSVGLIYMIGSEILDPPAEYKHFIKNL